MPKKRKLAAKHAAQASRSKPSSSASKPPTNQPKKAHKQHHHDLPTIPFSPHERILLLGEGDLSFAASLVKHHKCTDVLATVFEKSEADLLEKYPHAKENLAAIKAPVEEEDDEEEVNWEEDYGSDWDESGDDSEKKNKKKKRVNRSRVVYNIDATKPFPASISRPPPERIIFNFPHVGGQSTDVNRQVRANQSLLVSFFTHALNSLSTWVQRAPGQEKPSSPPSIVVTLFEAEPYTLWNIRDLARHAGMQVERSFKFKWDAYPGYHHARTCGVIKGKDGKEGGGWKGEERSARSYVFVRKEEGGAGVGSGGNGERVGKRKRDKGDDDDSE